MQFITPYSTEVYGPLANMPASPLNPLTYPRDIGIITLKLEMRKPRLRHLLTFLKITQQGADGAWTGLCSAPLRNS